MQVSPLSPSVKARAAWVGGVAVAGHSRDWT